LGEPYTNALVVTAPSRIMQNIMAVVDQIDIPRAQVQVNAVIVEMSEEKAAQLGVTWAIDGSDSDDAIGLTNFGSTTPGVVQLGTASQADVPSALAIPEGGVFAVGRIRDTGTSWAAIVSALRGDGNVNIISEPQIMVLDNAEAEQHVGQEVPFRTGEYAQVGQVPGAVNPFTTIDREPVGTTLRITPQINEGSGMILTIELEQSSIAPGALGAADLILNQRRITTEVFAEDGEIIVLGGLIDDQLRENEQRVPGLGRIPGLGWLFRARNTERVRSNMLMFIRPTILRDSIQRQSLTNEKYDYIRQLQLERSEQPVRLMREETPPLLPPFEEGALPRQLVPGQAPQQGVPGEAPQPVEPSPGPSGPSGSAGAEEANQADGD
jgi:general secretion pathway protein D